MKKKTGSARAGTPATPVKRITYDSGADMYQSADSASKKTGSETAAASGKRSESVVYTCASAAADSMRAVKSPARHLSHEAPHADTLHTASHSSSDRKASREAPSSASPLKDSPHKDPPHESTTAERNAEYADAVFAVPLRRKRHDGGTSFFWRTAPTIAFGILLFLGLEHFDIVISTVNYITHAFTPLIVAMALAFILSMPMEAFERYLFKWVRRPAIKRGLSVLLCYTLLSAFIVMFIFIIVPQLVHALDALSSVIPSMGKSIYSFVESMVTRYELDSEILTYFAFDWNGITRQLLEWVATSFPQVVSTTRDITAGMFETFLGVVLSIYILFGKDKLSRQAVCLTHALCSNEWADRLIALSRLTVNTFHGFITGQFTESAILGTLCGAGMTILGLPQPFLTGVLIGIGGFVPIFGIPVMITASSLLIAAQTGVTQALIFIAFILVLQQFEGNLIYPRVMGNAINLPGLWVLSAAVVSGSLFGFTGLIVSIPCASALYSLGRSFVQHRIERKNAGAPESSSHGM